MNTTFYGTGVAIVTPFNQSQQVDFDALGKLINSLIDGGVDYLVALGTTGETATLDKKEKVAVLEYVKSKVAQRVPIVAGIGGNNTKEILDNLTAFDLSKFDAVLSVSPYYNKPTQEGIYQHYKLIATNSPLPIILYNVPGRTSSTIAAETTLRLAQDCPNIIGIKEASANFDIFNQILRDKPENFLVISGDDSVALPMMALGAVGVISVTANALPQQVAQMVRLCLTQEFDKARLIHNQLIEFTKLLFLDGNPAGIKAALHIMHICENVMRLPLLPVNRATFEKIQHEINNISKLT